MNYSLDLKLVNPLGRYREQCDLASYYPLCERSVGEGNKLDVQKLLVISTPTNVNKTYNGQMTQTLEPKV